MFCIGATEPVLLSAHIAPLETKYGTAAVAAPFAVASSFR